MVHSYSSFVRCLWTTRTKVIDDIQGGTWMSIFIDIDGLRVFQMKDLVFFICFISIFIAGYSVSSYALISTPDQVTWIANDDGSPSRSYNLTMNETTYLTWNLLRNVVDWGVWKVYGQVEIIGHNQVGSVSSITGETSTIDWRHLSFSHSRNSEQWCLW